MFFLFWCAKKLSARHGSWEGVGIHTFRCVFLRADSLWSLLKHFRSWWPRGLRRRSAAARLLRLYFRIPRVAWIALPLWVLCVVRQRSLRRTEYSSIEVLSTVKRRFVWSRNLKNVEALARVQSQPSPCLVTFKEAWSPDSMICTRGCNYSFMYSS